MVGRRTWDASAKHSMDPETMKSSHWTRIDYGRIEHGRVPTIGINWFQNILHWMTARLAPSWVLLADHRLATPTY